MRDPVLLDQVRLKYADTTPPTVAIASSAPGVTAEGPVTFSFAFSEDVGTSFTADDISVVGGTTGTFTRVSGTQATLVVTPPANATGTITVSVAAGKFYDPAYNANTAPACCEQAYDTRGAWSVDLPITFDDPAVTYTLTGFGGAEDSTVVVDPAGRRQQGGQGREVGDGRAVGRHHGLHRDEPLGSGDDPVHGQQHHDDGAGLVAGRGHPGAAQGGGRGRSDAQSVETEATTTVANAWETLTFDFANQAAGTAALNLAYTYNKVSIFFNFGVTGATAGAKTYYFDDVAFGGGSGGGGGRPGAPITFDEPAVTYTLTGFGGAEDSTVVVDPTGCRQQGGQGREVGDGRAVGRDHGVHRARTTRSRRSRSRRAAPR